MPRRRSLKPAAASAVSAIASPVTSTDAAPAAVSVPITLTIPIDQIPKAGELPPGMDAETAERLHPPAEMPPSSAAAMVTPSESPEQVAERTRWEQRRARAREQVDRLLARYRTHEVPVHYPGAVDMARELVLMALSAEDKPCPHCGAALGPRLPREEAEARELETQATLLARSFGELLQREEERRLRERRAAHPLTTKGTHGGATNPAKGVKGIKGAKPGQRRPDRSGAPRPAAPTPIFSRRPPPGAAATGGSGYVNSAALSRALARQA